MIRLYALLGIVNIVLMVCCLVDAISTDEHRMRNLPKIAWILLILFFPLAGSIAWLVAGRPVADRPQAGSRPDYPEYDRPGRALPADPANDEAFLRQVRERAEEQRRRYQAQKRAEERARLENPEQE